MNLTIALFLTIFLYMIGVYILILKWEGDFKKMESELREMKASIERILNRFNFK